MCEKPISLHINEIDECYNEAKKHNVPLLCGYQRRSDPSFQKLVEACHKGEVGTLQIVKTISRDNPVPTLAYLKISGGIFHDCGSHDLDVCRWILREDPSEVFAVASAFNTSIKEIDDFDTILITMKFPSGAIASVDLSRKAIYGYDQRIEVLGDKGMAQAQNRQPTTMVLSNESGIHTDPFCYSFPQRYDQAYARELDHFVDVILRKAEPRLTHDDARKVAIIANAAEESARSGQRVIIHSTAHLTPSRIINSLWQPTVLWVCVWLDLEESVKFMLKMSSLTPDFNSNMWWTLMRNLRLFGPPE